MDDESGKGCLDSLSHVEVKKEVVLGFLRNIKVDKSPGPDGIYPRILRGKGENCCSLEKSLYPHGLQGRSQRIGE